jgi:hypothetical protein
MLSEISHVQEDKSTWSPLYVESKTITSQEQRVEQGLPGAMMAWVGNEEALVSRSSSVLLHSR